MLTKDRLQSKGKRNHCDNMQCYIAVELMPRTLPEIVVSTKPNSNKRSSIRYFSHLQCRIIEEFSSTSRITN